MKNEITKDLIPLGLLFSLSCVFFEAVVFRGQFFFRSDIINLSYPALALYAENIKNWTLPLWTTTVDCGFPLMAEGQTGMFYPLNFITFLLFSPHIAYSYSVVLHFFLLGVFTYAYARSINVCRAGAVTSAIVLTFSGFFVTRLDFRSILQSAIWLPLIFFLIETGFRKNRMTWGLLAGFVLAAQFLGGHPQFTMYSLLASSLYFIFCLALDTQKHQDQKRFFKIVLLFILSVSLGLGISAVQLIPTYELSLYTQRAGGVGIDYATQESFPYSRFIAFIFPYIFPNNYHFWEFCPYVGVFPLFLALSVILTKRDRYVLFFSILLFLSLLLSMGKYAPIPLYNLLHFIPGFNHFRFVSRFLYLASFALAILAGIGFDYLLCGLKNEKQNVEQKIDIVFKLGFIGLAVFLFGNLILWVGEDYLQPYLDACLLSKLIDKISILNPEIYVPLFNFVLALFMLYLWKNKINPVLFKIFGIFIIIIDLFVFGMRYNPTVPSKDIIAKPQTATFLESQKDNIPVRIFIHSNEFVGIGGKDRELLQGNYIMLFSSSSGISSIHSANIAIWIKRYYDVLEIIKEGAGNSSGKGKSNFSQGSLNLLNLLNVKYILTPYRLNNLEHKLIFDGETKIYENNKVLPKAFVVSTAKIIPDKNEILREMGSDEFNPEKYIILEERPLTLGEEPGSSIGSTVKVVEYSSQHVNVSANLTGKGFLFLSDVYYPGWKAYVDGKEEKILRANYIFRALYLDKGQHEIEFKYVPNSFKAGLIITVVCLIICVSLIIMKKAMRK